MISYKDMGYNMQYISSYAKSITLGNEESINAGYRVISCFDYIVWRWAKKYTYVAPQHQVLVYKMRGQKMSHYGRVQTIIYKPVVDQISLRANLLWLTRRVFPYLYRMKGIGMNRMARHPSRVDAHSVPRFLYIAPAKSGKPAPNADRMRSLPA